MARTELTQSSTQLTNRRGVKSAPSSNGSESPEEKVHKRQSTSTAWSALRTLGNAVAQLFPTYTQDPNQVEVKLLTEEDLAQNQEIQTLAEELGGPISEVADSLQLELSSDGFRKATNAIIKAFHEQRLDDIFSNNEETTKFAKLIAKLLEKSTQNNDDGMYECTSMIEMAHHYIFLKETTPKYKSPVATNKFISKLKTELEGVGLNNNYFRGKFNELQKLRQGERIFLGDIHYHYSRLIKTSNEIN